MDTLERRVERLERSCRRWRLGFLFMAAVGVAGASAKPGEPADAQFAHLTVQSLAIRGQSGGPFISAACDNQQASITLSSPAAPSVVRLLAKADSANLFLSNKTDKGVGSAALSVDQRSGFLDLRSVDGKDKQFEPE